MNKILLILSALMLYAIVNAEVTSVIVTSTTAPIYKNEIPKSGESPIYTASKSEKLEVLDQKKDLARVRSNSGETGWIKKNMVKPVAKNANSKALVMDEAKVLGFLENPQAVYILDQADPNFKPIKLDRSFSDNLAGNIDKETNQRLHDPNLKPKQ